MNSPGRVRFAASLLPILVVASALAPGLLRGASVDGPGVAAVDAADLKGFVRDAETGAPLADAHVFIASSMIGSTTRANGSFDLRRVPPGAHTLYVSMLGYAPARVDTLIRARRTYRFEIALRRTVLEGPEIVVTAERSRSWYRRLRKFERLFIGESRNARACELLNPEVLRFESRWWGKLVAEATEPLIIENRALGYRILYHLEEFTATGQTIRFDGEPLFEELEAADSSEALRWRENRKKAYLGSLRHFMRALYAGNPEEEGFDVYRRYDLEGAHYDDRRYRFSRSKIFEDDRSSEARTLDFHGYVEATYTHERAESEYLRWQFGSAWSRRDIQRSWVKLTDGPATLDASGQILEPYGVTVYGYFAFERIAESVPKEYRPP